MFKAYLSAMQVGISRKPNWRFVNWWVGLQSCICLEWLRSSSPTAWGNGIPALIAENGLWKCCEWEGVNYFMFHQDWYKRGFSQSLVTSPSPPGWSQGRVVKQRAVGGEGLANFALDHVFWNANYNAWYPWTIVECQFESRMSSVSWIMKQIISVWSDWSVKIINLQQSFSAFCAASHVRSWPARWRGANC